MMRRVSVAALVLLAASSGRAAERVDFSREILPILSDACFHCHGPDAGQRKAKLRLDDEKNVKKDRQVVVAGKSAESELYRRIASADPDETMPPKNANRKLTPGQVALIKRWIDEGASWGEHWAFTKVVRPAVPRPARDAERVRTPIDAFIFSKLEAEGLTPSPPATREALIRRVTLDLTGLPPTPAEVDAFVQDRCVDAYERVVDRLLNSPAYGERMAWDWLDAARYADSNGYQGDGDRTMYPWRDWVVEAFNRNMPYDEFTVWQLAGDLLPGATAEQKLATAFCRNHMINGEGGRIPEENRVDYVMDMAETTGTVWLGLTFNCCRCHDHKYDPLSQRDYYSLFAFFNQTPVDGGGDNPQTPPVIELLSREQKQRLVEHEAIVASAAKELDAFELKFYPRPEGKSPDESEKASKLPDTAKKLLKSPARDRRRGQLSELEKAWPKEVDYVAQLVKLRTALEKRDELSRSLPRVMVMEDMKQPRQSFVLSKGLYDKRGDVVTAAVPAKMPGLPSGAPASRLGLARWLVAPDNPLTARVTVNRFWQQFFGIGLVKTSEDFGLQAENPSHPQLLDWLAAEFMQSGWDVKRLCRQIVTSAAYCQSSRVTPQLLERDPANRLLARGPRFRMPSWMIRDQALAASGLRCAKMGGAPVRPYQPTGIWEEATFGAKQYRQDKGDALYRRSVYTFWRRIVGPTLFFDTSPRQYCTVKQLRTNSPLHALTTLNDVTYVEAARHLAERALATSPETDRRLESAFRLVLARRPSGEEMSLLRAGLERVRGEFNRDQEAARKLLRMGESPRNESLDPVEHAAYTTVCGTILNLDEALMKE